MESDLGPGEAGNAAPDVESLVVVIERIRKRALGVIDDEITAIVDAIEQLPAPKPRGQHKELRDKLGELRSRRKHFSIDAINVNGLHCLKNLRSGKVQYPPPRRDILRLADYLGCSPLERNRLLLSVGYQPLPPIREGAQLLSALIPLRAILAELTLPAAIINRDWSLLDANTAFLAVFGVSREEFDDALKNDPDRLNILRQLFDANEPVYKRLNATRSPGDPHWRAFAAGNLRFFKQENVLCRDDNWYDKLREKLWRFEPFREMWPVIEIDARIEGFHDDHHEMTIHDTARSMSFFIYNLTSGDVDYPQIIIYMPKLTSAR